MSVYQRVIFTAPPRSYDLSLTDFIAILISIWGDTVWYVGDYVAWQGRTT